MTLLPGIGAFMYQGSGIGKSSYTSFNKSRHQAGNNEPDIEQTHVALSHSHRDAHSWTEEEYLVLMLMARFFDNKWPEIATVLTKYFPAAKGPFIAGYVNSYFHTIRKKVPRKNKSGKIFTSVFENLPFHHSDRDVLKLLDKIERTGRKAGVILRRRLTEDMSKHRPGYVPSKSTSKTIQSVHQVSTQHHQKVLHTGSSRTRALSTTSMATDFLSIKDEDEDIILVEHRTKKSINTMFKGTYSLLISWI
jgi:hypothetical protein